jgi:hypothetical protein
VCHDVVFGLVLVLEKFLLQQVLVLHSIAEMLR